MSEVKVFYRSMAELAPSEYATFIIKGQEYLISWERVGNILLKEEWVDENGVNVPKYIKEEYDGMK